MIVAIHRLAQVTPHDCKDVHFFHLFWPALVITAFIISRPTTSLFHTQVKMADATPRVNSTRLNDFPGVCAV